MKGLLTLLFSIILLISCNNKERVSEKTSYKINPEIASEIDINTKLDGKLEMGAMEIKVFEDDSLVAETFSSDKCLPFWIMPENSKNSIQIMGIVGLFDASGFRLGLTKTNYDVNYFSSSDFGIYKVNKKDTTLTGQINLKCKKTTLVLEKYPQFEKGNEISGIVEFKTPDYWEVSNGKEKKVRIEAKAYFKTKIK